MQRFECDAAHKAVFVQNDMKTFNDVFGLNTGQTVNRNEKRDVSLLRLDGPNGPRVYFRKRFFSPHPKDMLFTIRNVGRLCSQAELEWQNARALLDNGIETYRPAAWGADTICGIERRSFFVTEKIEGRSLIEYLLDRWHTFDAAQRDKLVVTMARFFRKIHRRRISLPDSYLWHLFVLEPIETEQTYRFAIIDLHRMQINAAGSHHHARNLAALLFSLPDEWFDDRLRELFITAYLEPTDGQPVADRKAFLDTLKKRERTLIARRRKPDLEHLKKLA